MNYCSDSEGKTDMLTHLGPFVSYGQQHSCGPDPDVSSLLTLPYLGITWGNTLLTYYLVNVFFLSHSRRIYFQVCCMFNFMDMRNGGFRECFKNGSVLVPTTEENVVERLVYYSLLQRRTL